MLGLQSEPHKIPTPRPESAKERALRNFESGDAGTNFGGDEGARYFHAATVLMKHGEYTSAQQLLRKTLQLAPYSAAVIRELAVCASKLGQDEEGLRLLESLIRVDDHPIHLIRLADTFYDMGRDQEALKHYLAALRTLNESAPEHFDVYKAIGNIFVRCRDFESAEENYNKAFRINPNSAILHVNLGTLEIQRENWDMAVQRYREAIVIDASCDRAWVGLALVHRQFGDHQLSWANLARAIDHNPDNATALQMALSWVVKDGHFDQVTRWMVNYIGRHGEDAMMSLALAQLWFLRGRFFEARMELERTMALDPKLPGSADLLDLIEAEEMKGFHGRNESREGDCAIG